MAKRFFNNDNIYFKYLICFGSSVLSVVLLSFVMAVISNFTKNPGGLTDILSLCALVLSAVFCGIFSVKLGRGGSVGFSTLVALGVALVMLISCLIVRGAKVPASAFMNYACFVGISALCATFAKRSEGNRKRRRRKN